MTTLFLGSMKNLLHNNKSSENAVERITNNLSKSNIGLHKSHPASAADNTISSMDSFDITKHISDLLSPACGWHDRRRKRILL